MKLKHFFGHLLVRIQNLILKLISASFVTWVIILYAMKRGWLTVTGSEFLLFTGAVIGLKVWGDKGKAPLVKDETEGSGTSAVDPAKVDPSKM